VSSHASLREAQEKHTVFDSIRDIPRVR